MRWTHRFVVRLAVVSTVSTLACSADPTANPSEAAPTWPARVLVTNDNGIDDPGMVELARALAEMTETYVVAATSDRSGTTNLMSGVREGEFWVERRDLGEGIEAWALDGYPADCVLFALAGPMRERLPDLVISGINGGANLGDDWFGSGTIGAARTAAYVGIPAIAISGLDDDHPEAVRAAVSWVVELVRSEAVRALRPPQYLTVSLPLESGSSVAGVEVVPRARGLISGSAERQGGGASGAFRRWKLDLVVNAGLAEDESDVAAVQRRSIAVVPMRVDESDPEFAARLREAPSMLPAWSAPEVETATGPRCRSGFGAMIDDAEDESGREWGVVIEEVLPGGKAEETGLRPGDVIVSVNGIGLETPRRSEEDPDDRLVKILNALGCGESVTMEYDRDGERGAIRFETPGAPD